MSEAIPEGFENVACLLCGGGTFAVTHKGRDWILHHPVTLRIVRCNDCGLHYTNPRPTLDRLGDYYPGEYAPYQRDDGDSRGRGWLKDRVLREAYGAPSRRPSGIGRAAARAAMLVKSPRSFGFGVAWRGEGKLLDFGCGAGKFLRRMDSVGWDVTGLDFSTSAVESVRKSGLKALQGTLPHPELGPASFDVVTLRHALEHVPAPLEVLRAVRELLRAGGQVVIQVPNYASWERDYFGDASPLLDLPRHLTHFTPATLRDMLTAAGFASIDVRQVCRSNWLKKAAKQAGRRGSRRMGDRVLRWSPACRAVALVCRWRGRGNEIVAIAERG
ncbi:MAG: class I SAM-dependent methyltransferase [Tepidisphaeraceae bacterium]